MNRFARFAPWTPVLYRYLIISACAHLAWEIVQLPLYTLFWTASTAQIAFDVIHCTAGDVLIALATFMLAVAVVPPGSHTPHQYAHVAILTVVLGVAYTVFSEWLNVTVSGNWAYTDDMPCLPFIGTGLAPLLEWIVVPTTALLFVGRRAREALQQF